MPASDRDQVVGEGGEEAVLEVGPGEDSCLAVPCQDALISMPALPDSLEGDFRSEPQILDRLHARLGVSRIPSNFRGGVFAVEMWPARHGV